MTGTALAADFGTSNSAVAIPTPEGIRRIPLEADADTLPTAVFFPAEGGAMEIGERAGEALIRGEEGRYMRALKSVLGTPLLHERRMIGGQRRSLADVITAFLSTVKTRAEAATGHEFTTVLSGRPVHFHSRDAEADARAEADLRACWQAAGFDEVSFLAEPEAAALTAPPSPAGSLGLVVDIGGGTSDFTLFRSHPTGPEVLVSHGIRLGGTDFDHAVSMSHAMSRLGHGGELRREMGTGLLPVPNGIYSDLATWAKIPFLYVPEVRREVATMLRLAVEPKRMARLQTVLDLELGHALAFAVERGKIAAGSGTGGGIIDMGMIQPKLGARISPFSLAEALMSARAELEEAIAETLSLAGRKPDEVTQVVLVGGSSLMPLIEEMLAALFPKARQERAHAFTAVVDGLALSIARNDRTG